MDAATTDAATASADDDDLSFKFASHVYLSVMHRGECSHDMAPSTSCRCNGRNRFYCGWT